MVVVHPFLMYIPQDSTNLDSPVPNTKIKMEDIPTVSSYPYVFGLLSLELVPGNCFSNC